MKAGPANYLTAGAEAHVDSEFKENDQLYWDGYTSLSEINNFKALIAKNKYEVGKMEYVAADAVYTTAVSLWGGTPGVSWEDARASTSLDNRYFMAALGSVAAHGTHILEHVFLTDEVSANGLFAVQMYLRGKPWVLTVDDKFWAEYDAYHLHLKYATIYRDHIWVPLLEKAWAKLLGSYSAVPGRHAVTALHALTGAPVFNILTSTHATGALLFADVEAALAKDYLITAKTKSTAASLASALVNS